MEEQAALDTPLDHGCFLDSSWPAKVEEQTAFPFFDTEFEGSESEPGECQQDEGLSMEDRVLFEKLAYYIGDTLEGVCAMKEEVRQDMFRALGMCGRKEVEESCTKGYIKQLDDQKPPASPPRHRPPARRQPAPPASPSTPSLALSRTPSRPARRLLASYFCDGHCIL